MKRIVYYILASVFAVYFIWIFSYTVDPKLDLNGDNAIYIALARNMADGQGYGSVGIDGTFQPANHFPPGYSALLSVAVRCGIDSLMGFKVLNAIFLFLSLAGLIYMLTRIVKQSYLVFAVAFLVPLCPVLMHFAGIVMSEMSYMFCTILSLVALFQYDLRYQPQIGKSRFSFLASPWFYIAIVSAVASYHIRTVGASIMFAVLVFFLFRKEWLASIFSVGFMGLLMLPWMLRNASYGIKGRYLDTVMVVNPWRPEEGNISSFSEFFTKMINNLDETVVKGFKEMLFPFIAVDYQQPSSFLAVAGGILLVAVIVWGAWQLASMRWAVIAFLLANIGLFALWHGGNGSRYVTPIVPVLFFCFYIGVYALVQLFFKRRIPLHSPWLMGVVLMVLFMIEPIQAQHKVAKHPYPVQYRQYFAFAEQLNAKAESGAVVCCRKPELFGFYAPKLRTTRYIYSTDHSAVIDDLYNKGVDFVVIEQLGYSSTPRYLVPAIQAYSRYFPVVWHLENPDAYLLRFDRSAYAGDKSNANVQSLD